MRVIVAMPGKAAEVKEIDNTLKAMQQIVGGHIETLSGIWFADMTLICNEEGSLLNLPLNRIIRGETIVGPIIAVKSNEETEDFEDIPEFAVDMVCTNLDNAML